MKDPLNSYIERWTWRICIAAVVAYIVLVVLHIL